MNSGNKDEEQLRILSILYYVWGGLGVLFSCLGGIYVLVMLGVFAAVSRHGQAPPPWLSGLLMILGGVAIMLGLVLSALSVWTGKCLSDHRSYTLCTVVAALTSLSVPFGTALGVFTLIVLTRPQVRSLFQPRSAAIP